MRHIDDEKPLLTNRERARQPRLGRYWCPGCDRNHIGDGERCSVCGYKQNSDTDKAGAR